MSESAYFVRECPTCGRRLHIRVEYMGRNVVCQHCRGRFVATSGEGNGPAPSAESLSLIERADELISMADSRRAYPR